MPALEVVEALPELGKAVGSTEKVYRDFTSCRIRNEHWKRPVAKSAAHDPLPSGTSDLGVMQAPRSQRAVGGKSGRRSGEEEIEEELQDAGRSLRDCAIASHAVGIDGRELLAVLEVRPNHVQEVRDPPHRSLDLIKAWALLELFDCAAEPEVCFGRLAANPLGHVSIGSQDAPPMKLAVVRV